MGTNIVIVIVIFVVNPFKCEQALTGIVSKLLQNLFFFQKIKKIFTKSKLTKYIIEPLFTPLFSLISYISVHIRFRDGSTRYTEWKNLPYLLWADRLHSHHSVLQPLSGTHDNADYIPHTQMSKAKTKNYAE